MKLFSVGVWWPIANLNCHGPQAASIPDSFTSGQSAYWCGELRSASAPRRPLTSCKRLASLASGGTRVSRADLGSAQFCSIRPVEKEGGIGLPGPLYICLSYCDERGSPEHVGLADKVPRRLRTIWCR
jgi:hypothetical protein